MSAFTRGMYNKALPPGPRMPAAAQTALWIGRPLPYLESAMRRFGDIFTLRWVGAGTMVFVCSPELVKTVFTGDPDVLHAGEGNALLAPLLGANSVLLLDGEAHLRQRKLLLPPFHGERMQAYGDTMRKVTLDSMARWPSGRPFALHPFMRDITLEVIIRTVFGIEKAERVREISTVLAELLDLGANPLALVPAFLRLDLFRLAPWNKMSKLKRRVDEALYDEIARRRRSGERGPDVLSMMLEARDEAGQPMTDVEVRDELMTLLAAGHETSATTLAWAFDRILAHPEIATRLQSGDDEYLDAVVKEVLRLRPIVPIVTRLTKAPFEVGGWTLPAGVRVTPCIYLVHRRPDLYPQPDQFRPERFLGKKVDPYAWLPFGGGTRRCLGMAFALYEIKIVLATVMKQVRLRLASPPARAVRRGVTLAPQHGTRVVLAA